MVPWDLGGTAGLKEGRLFSFCCQEDHHKLAGQDSGGPQCLPSLNPIEIITDR